MENNKWVRHRGGKCPVDGEIKVETRQRGGQKEVDQARDFWWEHRGNNGDIMAYRIHNPAEQPELVSEETIKPAEPGKFDAIAIRDRIRALDTQRAEVESTYQRKISEITQERELLVQKLAGEGLALVEVVVGPVEDMSDWRNWKVGDLVKLADKVCEETGMEPGSTGCISEFDRRDTRGNYVKVDGWYWPLTKNLTWVSRPAS